MADYAVEAPDTSSLDASPPFPSASSTSITTDYNAIATRSGIANATVCSNMNAAACSGLGADLGNPVQDDLTKEAGVATFKGKLLHHCMQFK